MNIIEIYGDVLKEKDARITTLESENAALKRTLWRERNPKHRYISDAEVDALLEESHE